MDKSGFEINMGSGFRITFENGTSISVQWSVGHYCSNRLSGGEFPPRIQEAYRSGTAEIYIEDAQGKELTKQFDKSKCSDGYVIGWCDPEYVAKAIAWTARYDARYGKKLYGTTLNLKEEI